MNVTTFLVGLASGAASAALSVSLLSGSLFSLFLFVFAPLPILIAALGWRHHAGLTGAITGTSIVWLLLGAGSAGGYALTVALPGWWLAYLALLGQPADAQQPDKGLIWYPVGRLLVWIAAIGIAPVVLTVLLHDGLVEGYRASLRTTIGALLNAQIDAAQTPGVAVPPDDVARIVEMAALALPPLAAAIWTLIAMVNMWAAGRVVRASGRLARPWPDLAAFNLPALALMAFVGGIVGSFLPGLFGFTAGIVCAAFTVVFAALGLALLHMGTRGRPGRGMLLGVTYALLSVLPWMGALLAALGVLEFLFGMRARITDARLPSEPTI